MAESAFLPLDPDILLFLKFFVVFTCFFFWIRMAYTWMFRRYHRIDRYHKGG